MTEAEQRQNERSQAEQGQNEQGQNEERQHEQRQREETQARAAIVGSAPCRRTGPRQNRSHGSNAT